jgi:uncharacterized membrane protein
LGLKERSSRIHRRTRVSGVPEDSSIDDVARLERTAHESRSAVDRIATAITRKAGTSVAIVVHGVWFLVWIGFNVGAFGVEPFDPYPFRKGVGIERTLQPDSQAHASFGCAGR